MILITKTDEWSNHAGRLAQIAFSEVIWIRGNIGDPIPDIPEGGLIISFLSPWIIPASVLEGRKAINFHPGSRKYPGIGCYNFALHEGATEYGAVCHEMRPAVDTGKIIKEVNFPVFEFDTVETLKFRTMIVMLQMFHELICQSQKESEFVWTDKWCWSRRPFTRKQLDQLYADFPNTRATIYPDA